MGKEARRGRERSEAKVKAKVHRKRTEMDLFPVMRNRGRPQSP